MSDRKPPNPELCKHADWLIVQRNDGHRWVTCTECHTDFIPESETIAAVRRGVESGEIEGEVRKSIVTVDPEDGGEAFYVRVPHDGYWLMIPAGGATNGPVSDGGSET